MKKILLAVSLVCLASCSGLKSTLGINKVSPNEYTVLRQAPLSMPPSDYMLPPAEQSQTPQTDLRSETGEEILYGKTTEKTSTDSSLSQSDRKFLANTAHVNKKENIKEVITQENAQKDQTKKKSVFSFFNSDHEDAQKSEADTVKPDAQKNHTKKKSIFSFFNSDHKDSPKPEANAVKPVEIIEQSSKKGAN